MYNSANKAGFKVIFCLYLGIELNLNVVRNGDLFFSFLGLPLYWKKLQFLGSDFWRLSVVSSPNL